MSAGVTALLRPRECAKVARLLGLPCDAVLADARHCTEAAATQATPLERLVTAGGAELEGRLRRVHAAFSVLGNRAASWTADGSEPLIDSARFFKVGRSVTRTKTKVARAPDSSPSPPAVPDCGGPAEQRWQRHLHTPGRRHHLCQHMHSHGCWPASPGI